MRISQQQNKSILPREENADSLQQGDGEDEYANDHIYDNLDVAAHPHAKPNPNLLQTEYLNEQLDDREGTSQLLADDACDDLRYDLSWRTNLRDAGSFNESLQVSAEECHHVPEDKSNLSRDDTQGLMKKGGYRYIVDSNPAVAVTPHVADMESDQPYHLHPQDGQTSSITPPHCHSHVLHLTSPESDRGLQKRFREKHENSCDSSEENSRRSPELSDDFHALTIQESDTNHLQKLRQGATQMSTSTKVLLNKKPERQAEDIVERNKITLGRNTSNCGSYMRVHALKQEKPHSVNKVTQIRDGKKAQQKETPSPPRQQQQPPAQEVKAEWGDGLSSPGPRPAAVTLPNPQTTSSSQALLPDIHLSTSLNPPSHVLPLIQQRGQDDIILVSSPPGCPPWSFPSELALFSGCQQTSSGKSSQMSWEGVNQRHHRSLQSSPEQWLRSPTTSLSLGSSPYTVVPPIGESAAGKEKELSPGVDSACRSSSDGYLAQMEKEKQLRNKVSYKEYSLKDYKQLKLDITLGGLGADYTTSEKTKIKRQKLYSNVIREQNKKISRIPFLLAKDPEGNDKNVPRIKALEYAKTIAKRPVKSQPKQRQKHQSEVLTEHAPYVSQLATVEVLRKRHEEEKQAVALFRKLQAD